MNHMVRYTETSGRPAYLPAANILYIVPWGDRGTTIHLKDSSTIRTTDSPEVIRARYEQRPAGNKPVKVVRFRIDCIWSLAIEFSADPEIAKSLEEFGRVYNKQEDAYTLFPSTRYDRDELLNYLRLMEVMG